MDFLESLILRYRAWYCTKNKNNICYSSTNSRKRLELQSFKVCYGCVTDFVVNGSYFITLNDIHCFICDKKTAQLQYTDIVIKNCKMRS